MMPSVQTQLGLEDYKFTVKNWVQLWKEVGIYQLWRVKQNDAISFIMGNVKRGKGKKYLYFSACAALIIDLF